MTKRIGVGFCGVTLSLVMGAGCTGETTEEAEVGAVQQQIVAGTDADKGEYPWVANIQIRLGEGWFQNCTGSLIAPNWVLTAAHCLYSGDEEYPLDQLRITLGDHSLSDTDGDEQVIAAASPLSIVDLHPHPDYSGWVNDVGLIELSDGVEINEWVQTVPLADGDDGPQPASGAGWGVLNVNPGDTPDILQEAVEEIVSHEACGALTPLPRAIDGDDICFGSGQVTQVCHGDSGGPLTVERSSGCFEQVGVSSFGTPQCDGGYSVYARVSKYLPWIASVVPNLDGGTTYEAEQDMAHTAGGTYDEGWNLHSNGDAYFTHAFEAGSNTLIVTAAGEQGQGWPNMRVTVGGQQVFNQPVTSPTWADYSMTFNRSAAGNAEVRIQFTNDLYLPGIGVDRNLLLDKARVPGDAGCSSGGSTGALTTTFNRESVWNTGYCARISMTNPAASPTTSWTANVNAVSGTVSKYWTPETLTNTSTVTFPSESWNAVIQPNGTYGTAGFCVNHPPGGYVPPVITVNATY